MPYIHRKEGDKNCVYKKNGGAKVGCTKGNINDYLGALYANADENENKAIRDDDSITITETTKDLIKRLIRENLNKKTH